MGKDTTDGYGCNGWLRIQLTGIQKMFSMFQMCSAFCYGCSNLRMTQKSQKHHNFNKFYNECLMIFQSKFYIFSALQACLRNFKNVIWTHYLLCLQHVGYFAETSKNQKVLSFFESFSYRFLITFCRSPDFVNMNQNGSQNGASVHQKSQKNASCL